MTDQDKLALGSKRAEELGLREYEGSIRYRDGRCWTSERAYQLYKGDDIHKLLGEGVEVWSHINGTHKPAYWGPLENGQFNDTHCGLTIGIRPLVQESREQKLERMARELLSCLHKYYTNPRTVEIMARAEQLLERP